jgi:hypothetical protein
MTIEEAIRETEYKYFGDYGFSGDQREAVNVLVEAAHETLRLREFANTILRQQRGEIGDVDGGFIEDTALRLGLLVAVPVTESCGDACRCDVIPGVCIRFPKEASNA